MLDELQLLSKFSCVIYLPFLLYHHLACIMKPGAGIFESFQSKMDKMYLIYFKNQLTLNIILKSIQLNVIIY